MTKWSIEGPQWVNCNCDAGCPCQFNSLPTHDDCHAVSAGRITQGHYGEVKLDGLGWAAILKWPGPIHEGNGEAQIVVDERADEKQRAALEAILTGQDTDAGATHFAVFASTMTKVHPTLARRIEFEMDADARTANVSVEGVFEGVGEPIRNPVTGDAHRARINMPEGFEYEQCEVGTGTSTATADIPMVLKGSHAHWVTLHMNQHGVVR